MMRKRKRRLVFSFFIVALLFYGCTPTEKHEKKAVHLKMFSFDAKTGNQQPVVAEDSFGRKGAIYMPGWRDTVYFNFGYGDIDNLAEKDPEVVYHPYNIDSLKSNLDTNIIDTSKVIFTNKVNYDIDEFRKQNVFFNTINRYRAKITVPREIGNGGITGVYFDSLRKDDGGRLKFNFFITDLDSLQNDQFVEIIKSIRFHLE